MYNLLYLKDMDVHIQYRIYICDLSEFLAAPSLQTLSTDLISLLSFDYLPQSYIIFSLFLSISILSDTVYLRKTLSGLDIIGILKTI